MKDVNSTSEFDAKESYYQARDMRMVNQSKLQKYIADSEIYGDKDVFTLNNLKQNVANSQKMEFEQERAFDNANFEQLNDCLAKMRSGGLVS